MSDTVMLDSPPLPDGTPGELIAGKYRLERVLGRGAMGTVWLAVHTTLGQRVAIKLIAPEQAGSPEARRRFGLEAKAAARLKSRHVVQVYDDGETPDGTPYIVMEYLDGETLEQRLERQRDIGLGEAVRITTHVARALARAHAQGIVHRDLKPANVFLARTEDDELGWVAKVLDFGVAKLADSHGASTTKTGTIVGTPLFMSPEQIRGASHVDHRADLYSLGMVFYNMVTGAHAFDGPSYSDVLVAICTEPLPDIRTAAPWLPAPLRAWFDKACAREREQRFQSADELIEALQQAAGGAGRATRPSIPDDMGGPSGTLLGYSAPDDMTAVEASDVMLGAAAPRRDADVASSGTLRSPTPAPPPAGRATPTAPEVVTLRPNRLPALALWGAAGVALALLTGLVLTVFVRASRDTTTTEAGEEPRPATTAPADERAAAQERPAEAREEPTRGSPAPEIAPHAPLPATATATPPPGEPSSPPDQSSAARGRPGAGPKKPAQTTGRTPPAAAAPERQAAPDMGF